MKPSLPLGAFPLIRTSNIDDLAHSLGRIFVEPDVKLLAPDKRLEAVQNFIQLENIGIGYGSYGTDLHFRFSESSTIAQLFPLRGKGEIQIAGKSIVTAADGIAILPADSSFEITSSADYERLTMTIRPASLTKLLSAMTGESIDSGLKMDPLVRSAQSVRLLREHFFFLVKQISVGQQLPSLVLAEFEQSLLVMFLRVNGHNYSHLLNCDPADAAAQDVCRAEEYIEENWYRPVRLESLAAEVGVPLRSLFRAFRRINGYSPLEFLRERRLRHAQKKLEQPDSCADVESIAFACGFNAADRFERAYLRAFGEHPSDALARSKGANTTRH